MLYSLANPDFATHFSFQLANNINSPWIPNADVYNDSVDKIKNISGKKIVLLQSWYSDSNRPAPVDYSWADLIVFSTGEIINKPWEAFLQDMQTRYNNTNLIFISAGYWRSNPDPNCAYTALLEWFDKVVAANDYVPTQVDHKPYLFDALLGLNRYHRWFVFNKLKDSNLLNQSLVSLAPDSNSRIESMRQCFESPDLKQYDDINRSQHTWEEKSSYRGIADCKFKFDMWGMPTMSVLIPEKIYNASWYSIVCETQYEDGLFLTEKTAKPIFAKRIFVFFGAPGQLKFLQQQGFKTFDGIVDESYDDIVDNEKRFEQAWQAVLQLSNSDPLQLYQQAQPILEHNYRVLVDIESRQKKVQEFIAPFLP
jgi:hypothetical protein